MVEEIKNNIEILEKLDKAGRKIIERFGANLAPGLYNANELNKLLGISKSPKGLSSNSYNEYTLESFMKIDTSSLCSYDRLIIEEKENNISVPLSHFFIFFVAMEKANGTKNKNLHHWEIKPQGILIGGGKLNFPQEKEVKSMGSLLFTCKQLLNISFNLNSGNISLYSDTYANLGFKSTIPSTSLSLNYDCELQEVCKKITKYEYLQLFGECYYEIYEISCDKIGKTKKIMIIIFNEKRQGVAIISEKINEIKLKKSLHGEKKENKIPHDSECDRYIEGNNKINFNSDKDAEPKTKTNSEEQYKQTNVLASDPKQILIYDSRFLNEKRKEIIFSNISSILTFDKSPPKRNNCKIF